MPPMHNILRVAVIAIALSISTKAISQLKPDFKSDISAGCAPLVVKFQDLTTGGATQWKWDLGNGTVSQQQHPTATYFSAGTYNIKLVVTNATGADSIMKQHHIVVHANPDPVFSFSDSAGCSPKRVQFTDNSTVGAGSITNWTWDFGDGNVSRVQHPMHIYNTDGNYTVTLKVVNSKGCEKTTTKQTAIKLSSVKAEFDYNNTTGCQLPAVVKFISGTTGNVQHQWDFGDGMQSSLTNPVHNYSLEGTYKVQLIVSSHSGCSDTMMQQVLIGKPNADFQVSSPTCENATLQFQNISSANIVSSIWSFGDGTTSTQIHPTKVFASAGTYNVKLITNFGNCFDTVIKALVVHPKPIAKFIATGELSKCSPSATVQFSNFSTGASNYKWYYGDGATSTGVNNNHTYLAAGIYSVSLTVINSAGCTDSTIKADLIKIVPPKIKSISGAQFRGCGPYTANLSATIDSPEPVVSWLWHFGDGNTSTSEKPVHKYNLPGKYVIKLVITTAGGCKDSLVQGSIEVSNKPIADFTAVPPVTCASGKVQFNNTSAGANEWFWSFGDGSFSVEKNPIHQFGDTGFFTVKLVVGSTGCYDTIVKKDYIRNDPPVGRFRYNQFCEDPYKIQFRDSSSGGQRYKWYFGDGDSSTLQHPAHVYRSPGKYTVIFIVYHNSCYYQTSAVVNIVDEKPMLNVDGSSLCRNTAVDLQVANINSNNITLYEWSFGDGKTASTTAPLTAHQYSHNGTYVATLITTDVIGCKDSIRSTQPVTILGPTASFKNIEGTCLNSSIEFVDLSRPDASHAINKWEWSFGDGNTATYSGKNNPRHTYTSRGKFDVQLTVTDAFGCSDQVIRNSAIEITNPVANFTSSDSVKCSGNAIQFTNASEGVNLKSLWSFGDAQTSISLNPTHSYTAAGNYNVRLIVTDKYACTDTIVKLQVIANAVASFNASDTFSTCPPLLVDLTNQSRNSKNQSWDFGDGSLSANANPSHYYTNPGVYQLKLLVNGYGSCKDSVFKTIVLKGPSGSFDFSPGSVCAGDSITFKAITKNNSRFVWDFTDGTTISSSSSIVKYAYDVPGTYEPRMILVDSAGCQVPITTEKKLKVLGVKAKIGLSQFLYCDTANAHFADSSIIMNDVPLYHKWNFGDGTYSSLANPIHAYEAAGKYKVKLHVTTLSGCSDSTELPSTISVINSPKISASSRSAVCMNDTLQLHASLTVPDSSAIHWKWNFPDGSTSLSQTPSVSLTKVGRSAVSVTATNSSGCNTSANLNILVHPLPDVKAGTDTMICRGQSYLFKPTGATTYAWKNDESLSCTDCPGPVATPQHDVMYVVTGYSEFGCERTDSIQIQVVQPFTMSVSKSDTLCAGDKIQLRANGAAKYKWFPAEGLSSNVVSNPVAKPAATTAYMVIGSDSKNCFADTGYVNLRVFPVPQFKILNDVVTLAAGATAQMATSSSADVTRWKWYPAKNLSCTDCPQPVMTAKETMVYKAEVWNDGGCTATDKVSVSVVCNDGNVFIPNTFSPNRDGMNDVFYVRGKGIHSVKSMKVFNRWGDVVFEKNNFSANDENAGWNGIYKNLMLTPDVYVYIVDVVCSNNTVFTLKGNVTLIR